MGETSIYRKWCGRVDSGIFTHSQARQFAAAVSRQAAGLSPRGYRTNLTREEAERLWDRIVDRGGVSLTPEAEHRGEQWWRAHAHDTLGVPTEIVDLFERFTFHGAAEFGGRYDLALPIWRVHLTDGRKLDYYNPPWQRLAYGYASHVGPSWWWVTEEMEATEMAEARGEHR